MNRFTATFFLLFCFNSVSAQEVSHVIEWRSGVNQKTVEEWSRSLSKISKVSSKTYVMKKPGGKDNLHRKGHRDVIVWIPDSSDLTKPFISVIWFHGHWGYVPSRTFEDRVLKQFVPLTKDKNFVVVIPEMPWSVHTKTPTKRNSLLWMKAGSFMNFVTQIENLLINHVNREVSDVTRTRKRLGKIDYRIVGHSAGGSTIKRLGITGDLCKLNPSLVVWSDSSYGTWLQNAWDGCLKEHPNILVKVFVQKWQSPWKRTTAFLKTFNEIPENLKVHVKEKGWSHKLIGNNVVKLSDLLE